MVAHVDRMTSAFEGVGAHQYVAWGNFVGNVHDFFLLISRHVFAARDVLKALKASELSAKNGFVKKENFFGVSQKTEVRINCCHGLL